VPLIFLIFLISVVHGHEVSLSFHQIFLQANEKIRKMAPDIRMEGLITGKYPE